MATCPNMGGSATFSSTVRCGERPRDLVGARDAGARDAVRALADESAPSNLMLPPSAG